MVHKKHCKNNTSCINNSCSTNHIAGVINTPYITNFCYTMHMKEVINAWCTDNSCYMLHIVGFIKQNTILRNRSYLYTLLITPATHNINKLKQLIKWLQALMLFDASHLESCFNKTIIKQMPATPDSIKPVLIKFWWQSLCKPSLDVIEW